MKEHAVSTQRMAAKLRFASTSLETVAECELDPSGRRGEADVPLHPLADLVGPYCPVDSLIRHGVPDYDVVWERL